MRSLCTRTREHLSSNSKPSCSLCSFWRRRHANSRSGYAVSSTQCFYTSWSQTTELIRAPRKFNEQLYGARKCIQQMHQYRGGIRKQSMLRSLSTCSVIINVNVNAWICIAHHQRTSLMRSVLVYRANRNVFSKRLKAASVEFGLQTWSGRLFQTNGPAMAKARRP